MCMWRFGRHSVVLTSNLPSIYPVKENEKKKGGGNDEVDFIDVVFINKSVISIFVLNLQVKTTLFHKYFWIQTQNMLFVFV